mmetsp:Transcript_5903/g.9162  ORF Transcript_5903/g.9162 Transcript_5903/m.9162 type:complete len:178 (-) Transcript_5903:176-709(-)
MISTTTTSTKGNLITSEQQHQIIINAKRKGTKRVDRTAQTAYEKWAKNAQQPKFDELEKLEERQVLRVLLSFVVKNIDNGTSASTTNNYLCRLMSKMDENHWFDHFRFSEWRNRSDLSPDRKDFDLAVTSKVTNNKQPPKKAGTLSLDDIAEILGADGNQPSTPKSGGWQKLFCYTV